MTNIEDRPTTEPRRRKSLAVILLPPLLFFGAMMMAADFTSISLQPLKSLHIPYFKLMDYAPFIVPGACALIWLATLRKWPTAGPIVSVLLCYTLIGQIPRYADQRVACVPVNRWLESDEEKSFEARNGFAIVQTASSNGSFVIVAPENATRTRDDLDRLGILRGTQQVGK